MELNEQQIQNILDSTERVVVESEPVYGGERPTICHYITSEFTLVETIEYYEHPDSDGWANIKIRTYGIQ